METGWLIERHFAGSTRFLTEWASSGMLIWTLDSDKAIRFSTKEDAEELIEYMWLSGAVATEHTWKAGYASKGGEKND